MALKPHDEERTRLLPSEPVQNGQDSDELSPIDLIKTSPSLWFVIPVITATLLARELPTTTTLAIVRLIICRRWYEVNDPESLPTDQQPTDQMCEIAAVVTAYTVAITVMGILNSVGAMVSYGLVNLYVKKYGRKPVFITLTVIPCAAVSCLLVALNIGGNLSVLLAGIAVISEALASPRAVILLGRMYVVDTTTPMQRTSGMSFISAAAVFGQTPAYALGGLITEHIHVTAAFWIALALLLIVLLYEMLVLPESYVLEERREAIEEMGHVIDEDLPDDGRAGLVHSFKGTIRPIFTVLEPILALVQKLPGTEQRDYALLVGVFASFLYYIAYGYIGLAAMMRLINVLHSPPDQNGIVLSVLMGGSGLFLVLILPTLIKYSRILYTKYARRRGMDLTQQAIARRTDTMLIVASNIIDALGIAMIGLSKTTYGVLAAAIVMSFASGWHPAVNSLLVASVHNTQSDGILAANAMLESAGLVLSPIMLGSILSATANTFPSLVFYVSASIVVVSAGCILIYRAVDKPDRRIEGAEHVHNPPQVPGSAAVP